MPKIAAALPDPADAAPPAAPRLRRTFPGVGRCDGVFWFGNVDWWYHNRGHSSTRVATRLARRVPTVYINSIGMRMPVPGKTEIAWRRYHRKLGSLLKGLRRDEASGLWVYTPLFVPRYSARMVEFNGALLALQVRLLRRWLGLRRPSACVSLPTVAPAVERMTWVKVVFERCDDFTAMPGVDVPLIAALERRLLERCDHAAYVSRELFDHERDRVADAEFVSHGVDSEHLARARPLDGPRPPAPGAIQDLPRPLVGFFGGMDDYRMDAELILKQAYWDGALKHHPCNSRLSCKAFPSGLSILSEPRTPNFIVSASALFHRL